jgi:hypothetical protein
MTDKPAFGTWYPIETAPKDGSIIYLTRMEDGVPQEIWPMQWAHIKRNGLFPGVVGMWTTPDGALTWNGDAENGGPTHWSPLPPPEGEK